MGSSNAKTATGTGASAAAAWTDATVTEWPGAWAGGTGVATYSAWTGWGGPYEIGASRRRSDLTADPLPSTPAASVQNVYLYFDSVVPDNEGDYDDQDDSLAPSAYHKFRDWVAHGLTTKGTGVTTLTTDVYNDNGNPPPNYNADGAAGGVFGWKINASTLTPTYSQLILNWAVTDGFTYRE